MTDQQPDTTTTGSEVQGSASGTGRLPVIPGPPILCVANLGTNAALDKTFAEGGPYALIRDWVVPAQNAGCAGVLFRCLAWPLQWTHSFLEAMDHLLLPTFQRVMYTNPRASGWGPSCQEALEYWQCSCGSIVLETDDDYRQIRDSFIRPLGIEPAPSRQDPNAERYVCVVADEEWKRHDVDGQRKKWNPAQVAPWDMPLGYWRWHTRGTFVEPGTPLIDDVRHHYSLCRAPGCKAALYAVDYFSPPHSLTVAQIRGAA